MGYRIGSFNIRDFSKSSVYVTKQGESKKDLSVIADIIRENHYDIVAIQEIDHKEALRELLEKISFQYAELNYGDNFRYRNYSPDGVYSANSRTAESFGYRTKHWEGRWARPKSDYGNNVAEGYGFIWNRDRIRLADNRDNEPFEPRIADFGNVNELVRPPYIGRFRPINARYEFRLINTHIAYGNPIDNSQGIIGEKDDDIIKMSDSDYRKKEYSILIETVYADYCTQIFDKTRNDRNSRGLVPYTFLLGDYNLNMSSSEGKSSARLEKSDEDFIVRSNAALRVVTVNDRLTTLRGKPRSPEKEAELRADPIEKDHLANNYDHFTYDINTLIDHDIADPEIGVIMAFRKYDGKETSTVSKYDLYRNKVSDHLPIYLDIDIRNRRNKDTMDEGGFGYGCGYRKAN